MSRVASIRFSDLLPLAWSSLRRNRLRSFLTVGAIAVGIAVMVYLISLGYGLQRLTIDSVKNSSSLLSMTVKTASSELFPMTQANVAKISALPGVKQMLPRLTVKGDSILNNTQAPVTIVGVDPDYLQASSSTTLLSGSYYQTDDVDRMVVTTGFLALFGLDQTKPPFVNFSLQLDNTAYPDIPALTDISVSGIIESDSQAVYVPRPWIERTLAKQIPAYEQVIVTVKDINAISQVRNELIAVGFQVTATVDTVQDINRVFIWIQAILGGLGLIAIFVATIGMFNTLTISLLERTREIGIMKALGVKNNDIKRLFIYEAILMGILGGLLGIAVAFLLQQATLFVLSLLAAIANGNVPIIFSNEYWLLGGALIFAIFIATLTGIYPAMRATRLKPIDAISHE